MKIAKPSLDDLDKTKQFLRSCESIWDSRSKYNLSVEEEDWKSWDDEYEDKKLILQLQRQIAGDEGCDLDEVDNRILMYEFIRHRYKQADTHWGRVIMSSESFLEYVQDPQDDCLAFAPQFEIFHVAPEQ